MQKILKYFLILILCFITQHIQAQENENKRESTSFIVRGSVRESDSYKPISKVNIEVNGGAYTVTSNDGEFQIQVKKGDELVIRHKDFETVYYTITSNERISVEVKPALRKPTSDLKYQRSVQNFNSFIDSAVTYQKKDAEKSIQFITEALLQSTSSKENADAYEVLGDVYVHWKQYDLAVSNYRISLQNSDSNEVNLKLAEAYRNNKSYQESIDLYKNLNISSLSNWQLTILYEGLADTYVTIKEYDKAEEYFKHILSIEPNFLWVKNELYPNFIKKRNDE